MKLSNYIITPNGLLSKLALAKGLSNLQSLINFIQNLPYGRIEDRSKLQQVFEFGVGTCSSKHALIKAISIEQNFTFLQLHIGLYKMDHINTPGIKDELLKEHLSYLPEAHCYLSINGKRFDITNPKSNINNLIPYIIKEIDIEPHQTVQFKVDYHQQYLKDWIRDQNINRSFAEIWNIREKCIDRLSNVDKTK